MITTLPMSKKNRGGVAEIYAQMRGRLLPYNHGSQFKCFLQKHYRKRQLSYAKCNEDKL